MVATQCLSALCYFTAVKGEFLLFLAQLKEFQISSKGVQCEQLQAVQMVSFSCKNEARFWTELFKSEALSLVPSLRSLAGGGRRMTSAFLR